MKFKALITTLVLGTSSVAMAKPVLDLDYNANADLGFRRRPVRPMWMPLAESITASRRNVIRIDEREDNLSAIRLRSETGATYIYSLTLRFDDGTRKDIKVGKWLFAGAPVLSFGLDRDGFARDRDAYDDDGAHGGLSRIVVNTWTSRPATYSVLGLRSRVMRPRPIDGDDEPLPPPPPLPTQHAFLVGQDLTFANTPGYIHIPVGTDKGRFTTLRIESTGASTFIEHVHVTFANGNQQMLEVNKTFYRGEILDLDLEGGANAIAGLTLMASTDVRAVGPSASKFNVSLL